MMLLSIDDYRRQARRKLPRFVFDYVEGGADDEHCLARNTLDLRQLCLTPTCLRDTRLMDTSIDVFGRRWSMPVGIAPTGFNGLVRPRGDLLMAKAAAQVGIPFALSTASNERLESVHAAVPQGNHWFQLYVMQDRTITEQMVRRAQRERYGALVVTVDVPVSGQRVRDIRNGFRLPFRPTPQTILNLLRHPRWLAGIALHGSPSFVNLTESGSGGSAAQQAALLSRSTDRGFVWESLAWVRGLWNGPLLLKGILHPDDAVQAARSGIDGLIVSNHGGRQLDAAPSTISVLAPIVDAVGNRLPVFVDSGFRSGDDIVKALALGARAVFVGRAPIYGVACGGERGVVAVLNRLLEQLTRTMTLIGAARIQDIGRQHLLPRSSQSITSHPPHQ